MQPVKEPHSTKDKPMTSLQWSQGDYKDGSINRIVFGKKISVTIWLHMTH
ncbi:hypothetical protein DSUL_130014 [Desulfovibrionales bacterium]